MRVFSLQVPVLVLFRFLAGAVKAAKRVDLASKITNILSPAIFLALMVPIAIRLSGSLRHHCGPDSRAARRGCLPCLIRNPPLSERFPKSSPSQIISLETIFAFQSLCFLSE